MAMKFILVETKIGAIGGIYDYLLDAIRAANVIKEEYKDTFWDLYDFDLNKDVFDVTELKLKKYNQKIAENKLNLLENPLIDKFNKEHTPFDVFVNYYFSGNYNEALMYLKMQEEKDEIPRLA